MTILIQVEADARATIFLLASACQKAPDGKWKDTPGMVYVSNRVGLGKIVIGLDVEEIASVRQLKSLIHTLVDVSPEDMVLMVDGQELLNDHSYVFEKTVVLGLCFTEAAFVKARSSSTPAARVVDVPVNGSLPGHISERPMQKNQVVCHAFRSSRRKLSYLRCCWRRWTASKEDVTRPVRE